MTQKRQPSTLVSRNICVNEHRTSVRLEPQMWCALEEISAREGGKIHDICSMIAAMKKEGTSLTAAIRVFLMLYYKAAATEDGHVRAGHGDIENMRARVRTTQQQRQKQSHDLPYPATFDTQISDVLDQEGSANASQALH